MLIRLILLLFCFPIHATVFQKQPVTQQIKEADGIIIGHFLKSNSIRLENNSIATQMIFKMNKEYGMQSDFFGMDEIIVHYPGGKIGDENVLVAGVPRFIPGEKVVIMIKSDDNRYWGLNLGFGTFKVINYGNEKLIVNTIFPDDRVVGQMRMQDFEKNIRLIKGSRLKIVYNQIIPSNEDGNVLVRTPASLDEEGKNRAIASKTEQEENIENGQGLNPTWLLFLLALMGGLVRYIRQKEAK